MKNYQKTRDLNAFKDIFKTMFGIFLFVLLWVISPVLGFGVLIFLGCFLWVKGVLFFVKDANGLKTLMKSKG